MTDVVIIGAGPAGATAAALLAAAGHAVRVIEKQRFPRFSIGESLLAQTLQLIDDAGMLEPVLSAGFQFKNGAVIVRRDQASTFNFVEKTSPGYGYTFHVQRADFDLILANEAARRGARIDYETEVVSMTEGIAPQLVCRGRDGVEETLQPRYVLDASGFGRTLPRLLDLEKPSIFPPRAALYTHVEDHIVAGAFDRQKILLTVHPQHQDVWFWLIAFSNGRSSIGVVGDPAIINGGSGSSEERLWALIAEAPDLRALLVNAKPVAVVGEIVGYAASVKRMHGPGFALLGNAAEFIDPVFSSGVTIAMKSAHLAAAAVDRELRGEAVDWNEAFEKPLMLGVETFRGLIACWYDGSLQEVIFNTGAATRIRRLICSILAGYAWDRENPYVGPHAGRRIRALAATIQNEEMA